MIGREKTTPMRYVGLALILLGAAGALLLAKPDLRWESVGAAIVGIVVILTAKIDDPPRG